MTITDLFRLDDKVAVVTGASSGLGVAFAQALAEAGADVALGARRTEMLEDTAAQVRDTGRRALTVTTDVADPESCTALVAAACRSSYVPTESRVRAVNAIPILRGTRRS